VLAHLGEGELDHSIAFSSRKLSTTKKKYMMTKREGFAMVYEFYNFKHYLLGSYFNMYPDHSTLRYLVNKPMLGGRIFRWSLLFQEYDFKFIVKPGKLNVGSDYFSWILIREYAGNLDDSLPYTNLF